MKRIGHIYFTASATDVDAQQMEYLAWEAMKTSQSVAQAAHRLRQKSDEMAQRTAAHERQSVVDMCWGQACAEAVFFGIENRVPTMVMIKFEQVRKSRTSVRLIPHEFSSPETPPTT
jgi:hypothetical protein